MGYAVRKDFYGDGMYRCTRGLEGQAEYWWNARSLLESREIGITWEVFLATFFDKYFPDIKNYKEVEFM